MRLIKWGIKVFILCDVMVMFTARKFIREHAISLPESMLVSRSALVRTPYFGLNLLFKMADQKLPPPPKNAYISAKMKASLAAKNGSLANISAIKIPCVP